MFNHICLTITEFTGSYGTRYFCHLFTDNGKAHDSREISIDEARVLQWELIRKGATKTTEYNPFTPHVFTRHYRLLELNW
jgi:hypothetical protein